MLDIFHYSNAAQFLLDAWKEKRRKNPSFSMRSWSKRLGFKNNTPLTLMLQGKRAIPLRYIPSIAHDLALDSHETTYLEALVFMSRARTLEQRKFYQSRLMELAPKRKIRPFEFDCFEILSDPLCTTLMEMTDLSGFQDDPRWIQCRLRPPANPSKIRDTFNKLLNVGLLERDEKGRLRKAHRQLSSRPDIKDLAVQAYHQRASELAREAITSVRVEDRDFNSYSFNLDPRKLPELKRRLRATISELFEEFESPPEQDSETYQLNVQLFPMTKKENQS